MSDQKSCNIVLSGGPKTDDIEVLVDGVKVQGVRSISIGKIEPGREAKATIEAIVEFSNLNIPVGGAVGFDPQ